MLSPQALFKGLVSRVLPSANADSQNNDISVRLKRYGDVGVELDVATKHTLSDEGTYFTTNTAQTAIALGGATQTAFVATTPTFILYNAGNGPNIYLDYFRVTLTTAGTAGTSVQAAVVLDNGNRYSSGGTVITANIVSPNMSLGSPRSIAAAEAGALTATAATAAARTVVGDLWLKNAIPVAGDTIILPSGTIDNVGISAVAGAASSAVGTFPIPACVVGPNQSLLVYLWLPTESATPNMLVDAGWWER